VTVRMRGSDARALWETMLTSRYHFHSVCPSLWCRYRKTIVSHEPHCEITEKGKTVYYEQARAQPYLDEMASTGVHLPHGSGELPSL
jgi:hypothetical protein